MGGNRTLEMLVYSLRVGLTRCLTWTSSRKKWRNGFDVYCEKSVASGKWKHVQEDIRCTKIWISHSLIDLEHRGKHETFLIRKVPGILDKKNALMWEAGGQRKGRGNKMGTEGASRQTGTYNSKISPTQMKFSVSPPTSSSRVSWLVMSSSSAVSISPFYLLLAHRI